MGSIAARTGFVWTVVAALLWPAAAPGATPVRKEFHGDGADKTMFRVTGQDGRRIVRSFTIQLGSGCAKGLGTSARTIRVTRSGRFESTFGLGTSIYQRVSGRFTSSRRASGTFRARTRIGQLCDTGVRRWTATAADRRPVRTGAWRGATSSAGSALSFEVSDGGRIVSTAQGTVASNCDGNSTFSAATQKAIVAPDGSFRLPLTLEPGFFAGRFTSPTSAAGAVSAVLSSRDSIPTCFSGLVPWTASR